MKKLYSIVIIFLFFVFTSSVNAGLSDAFKLNGSGNGDPLDNTARSAGYITADASNRATIVFGAMIQTALSLLGVIFVLLAVYSGYNWMTAQGNQAKVEKAQKTLTAAIIGIIIVLSSYAISYYVLSNLSKTTLK